MIDRIETLAQTICAKYWEHEEQRWKYESEKIRLGDISDEAKLRLLKDYMFSRVHGDRDITNILRAIDILEKSIERKHRRDNDFIGKINQIISTSLVLLFLASLVSYFAIGFCGGSQKPICQSTTQLARYINQQFSDPK